MTKNSSDVVWRRVDGVENAPFLISTQTPVTWCCRFLQVLQYKKVGRWA